MFDPLQGNLPIAKLTSPGGGIKPSAAPIEGPSFSDLLKKQIGEVAQMQQEASTAVEHLATGKTDDVTGVFVAVEKSDAAFKTLLAIRGKLMDAYDEIKNIPI